MATGCSLVDELSGVSKGQSLGFLVMRSELEIIAVGSGCDIPALRSGSPFAAGSVPPPAFSPVRIRKNVPVRNPVPALRQS